MNPSEDILQYSKLALGAHACDGCDDVMAAGQERDRLNGAIPSLAQSNKLQFSFRLRPLAVSRQSKKVVLVKDVSKFNYPSVSSLVVHKRFWSSNYVSTLHFYTKKRKWKRNWSSRNVCGWLKNWLQVATLNYLQLAFPSDSSRPLITEEGLRKGQGKGANADQAIPPHKQPIIL